MVDALKKEVNSNVKNLKVYISPCLKRTHNAHFLKPKTIVENPKIWKGCVSHGFVRNVKIYTSKQFLYYLMNAFEYKINEENFIFGCIDNGVNMQHRTVFINPICGLDDRKRTLCN